MENPCKIIFFGDSITKGYAPILDIAHNEKYPEKETAILNAGRQGETNIDGIE